MTAESKYTLIALLEGFIEGLKNNTFEFTDEQGKRLVNAAKEILNPKSSVPEHICNISMACDYLNISQPTFRKYVRQGKIPEGHKVAGFTELIWDKSEIEKVYDTYFSKVRKGLKG